MGSRMRRGLRIRLVARQGRRCFYCQKFVAIPPGYVQIELGEKLWATIDHLKPLSEGGTNHIDNVVLACYKCHQIRHGTRPARHRGVAL